MKYETAELLQHWQEHKEEVAALTKHSSKKTAKKTTLHGILSVTNASRLLGCKVEHVGTSKYVISKTLPTSLVSGFISAFGDSYLSLPEFLSTYYPDVYQREDYGDALKLALVNLVALQKVAKPYHRPKILTDAQKLLYVAGRDDFQREDKRILLDVARAISLALINQVSGQPLTKEEGAGLYLTQDTIKSCMVRPTICSNTQLSSALLLLRIAGYIKLAQPEELTAAGQKLSKTTDPKTGKTINLHRIFTVSDFSSTNWSRVTSNFNLNLKTRITSSLIEMILDKETAISEFPDLLGGGVSQEAFNFIRYKSANAVGNYPIMTLKTATDTIQSLEDVSHSTAVNHVDQVLAVKAVQTAKMSASEAKANGYNLDGLNLASAEKVIVPTNQLSLLMCIERLKREKATKKNKENIAKVSKMLEEN